MLVVTCPRAVALFDGNDRLSSARVRADAANSQRARGDSQSLGWGSRR